ncbi:RNA polymerase sigma-70 factor [Gordonia pseudamarae]|jgi:RNA polymerase sigma-70 factor (ECF subfamily)|uniref:RNA polymerase sigma-70 factor n=1 Tax=Gordonia pseudamarae TaxID=2831662 RepID=A0ABX6IDA6_9ACTN|nr:MULTISPECIES: RNA polymerase sigma-70 factor [Gordonia]MBD0022085.1 RNA polymerase sigma-70 factor [Gordonia sp. (in: high G+C Gram-positive bacteria)]QHN24936.1 RNA polymerase sigma-70 factor [Gordonia pseudamarae]QHN33870.1 RNA polymerase sigma-70 factor [Gordonia pseudamarae]
MSEPHTPPDQFTEFRPLLFTVAYEILGSATEADDVLQESYLRWAQVDPATVRNPRAYLASIVTRQSLNALRAMSRRREDYVGPWLPEPILIDETSPADDVVLAESVSTAMLIVLESLTPDERAVFVLREVFAFDHDEIADIVGKSVATVRQIAHRARAHVHARRQRFAPVDTARATEVVNTFFAAALSGDVEQLMAVLAPDATYVADSDGKMTAARRPVHGAKAVAKLLLGLLRISGEDLRLDVGVYSSMPGFAVHFDGRSQGIFILDVVDGLLQNVYAIRNPDKFAGAHTPRPIAR